MKPDKNFKGSLVILVNVNTIQSQRPRVVLWCGARQTSLRTNVDLLDSRMQLNGCPAVLSVVASFLLEFKDNCLFNRAF